MEDLVPSSGEVADYTPLTSGAMFSLFVASPVNMEDPFYNNENTTFRFKGIIDE